MTNDCFEQKRIEVKQRPLKMACIDNTDVFILDLGDKIYQVYNNYTCMETCFSYWQWNGVGANKDEKFKAAQYLSQLRVC